MTRYDIAKFYGYNSVEEYDEAEKRNNEIFFGDLKKQKSCVEKESNSQPARYGKWIPKYDDNHGFHYVCSNCGIISGTKLKFCFDCGADMRGDGNE